MGILVCAFPGQQRPHSLSHTLWRRKGWWPCFRLFAAVGLLLAATGWQLGYNIEVSSAEKGFYAPAGILKPQRSYEKRKMGIRRVSFEDELQDDNTQEKSGVDSSSRTASAVSFQETSVQGRGFEGRNLQKQGALRHRAEIAQSAEANSNLERHSATVRQHADAEGVYERQSSESSSSEEPNTTHGELEYDGVKSGQQLGRVAAGGSLASMKEDDTVRRIKEKAAKAFEPGGMAKIVGSVYERFRKQDPRLPPRKRSQRNEQQAGETEAR